MRQVGFGASSDVDSMALAIAVALGLHLALIGLVHFDFLAERGRALAPSLDVILVDWASHERPESADFLAQASQAGGGEGLRVEVPDAAVPAPALAADNAPQQESASRAVAKSAPDRLVGAQPPLESPPMLPEHDPAADREALDARDLLEQSLAMVRTPARRHTAADFRQQPRRKFISAATREHLFASYMSAWIAKVERIGNMNYPEAARRQGIEGNLVLSVDILADGRIDAVRILRSSGHELLDEAALRIVRLSAPFAPLPAEMNEQVDILTITRTWQFSSATGLR